MPRTWANWDNGFEGVRSRCATPCKGTLRWCETSSDTPAQLALAWVLAQGEDIVPIPGTKRVERLEENTAAATVELTDAQLAELRAAADQIQIVGARYPEAQDRMVNQEAPLPGA